MKARGEIADALEGGGREWRGGKSRSLFQRRSSETRLHACRVESSAAATALKSTLDHTWILATDDHRCPRIVVPLSRDHRETIKRTTMWSPLLQADLCRPSITRPEMPKIRNLSRLSRSRRTRAKLHATVTTTRLLGRLDDGVHAATSNAHGPAAFTRMRSRLASRREMILRPGVSRPRMRPHLPASKARTGYAQTTST